MSSFLLFNAEMDITKIVCRNLVALRESTELNQTAFAKRCGLHQRAYGRIENGESVASLEMLEIIATKNDLFTWQLLTPSFHPKNPPVLKLPSDIEKAFYAKDSETTKRRKIKEEAEQ